MNADDRMILLGLSKTLGQILTIMTDEDLPYKSNEEKLKYRKSVDDALTTLRSTVDIMGKAWSLDE